MQFFSYYNKFLETDASAVIISISKLILLHFPCLEIKDYTKQKSINFSENDFLKLHFIKEDISCINNFKTFKKQIDWIAGKLAAKLLINHKEKIGFNLKDISVSYKKGGAPYFSAYSNYNLSISHSGDLAVAVISDNNIGIDIEKIEGAKSSEFINIAFSDNEIKALQTKYVTDFYVNWCIKEAYLKYIEKGFDENLKNIEILGNFVFHNNNKVDNLNIKTTIINSNYALALVTNYFNM
ncbi:MAG: 4'-phosphopantetheinyl transferase superfamily protein [Bacteroidales bacterium]|nr:4'-phosphopantetheinyl transferase superfamily protein [Bacteroidales bacterium]